MKKVMMFKLLILSLFIGCASKNSITSNIEVYNAYGNEHQLFVHGRMLIKDKENNVSKEDSGYTNIWNSINFFHNDEIKNKKVFLTVDKNSYETKSDDEGYFDFNIRTKNRLSMGYKKIDLQIEKNPNIHHAEATIITAQKMIGIISDIDDTVVVSDVTNKTELLLNTFWKNYKQREVIPTMVERFQKILLDNPPTKPSRLFFLSGSPQHLFTSIEKFLEYNHFPKHVTILKQVHGDNSDPLFDQMAYKTAKIEELIELYPNMKWVMFGDSGEKDREVYESIKKRYPSKVKGYYIRDVVSGEIGSF
jgi:phosphatidate phosphatase APP1